MKIIHKKFCEYASNFQSYKKVCSSSLILRENKVACSYLTSVFRLVLCLRLWHNHTQMEHLKVTNIALIRKKLFSRTYAIGSNKKIQLHSKQF